MTSEARSTPMAAGGEKSSSAERAFAVTELTEMILGHLPILALVCMQRTCRRFRDIIQSSKSSRRQLSWIPALRDTPHIKDYAEEYQRFITFDNTRKDQPIYSFRMWHSTSHEASSPIKLRFHETLKVMREDETTNLDFQGAHALDLRRRIVLDESERAVEVTLRRDGSMRMVEELSSGATMGELYEKLCDMSKRGLQADVARACRR